MGRGKARKGVALCWPPAGLWATPNIIAGVGRKAAGAGPGRGYYWEGGVQDRERGLEGQGFVGGCPLGAGRMDTHTPSHFSAERDREAGLTQLHASFMWFPQAISQS